MTIDIAIVPAILVGKAIADSRLGTIPGANMVGLRRRGRVLAAPGPSETLRAEDKLSVESGIGKLRDALHSLGQLRLVLPLFWPFD